MKAIADSIAVMYRGKVVRYGSKTDVLTPPFDAYTDLLLSSVPEMELGWLENAIKGRRMEDGERPGRAHCKTGPLPEIVGRRQIDESNRGDREFCLGNHDH